MIIILGESASGKSTVQQILMNKYGLNKIVTFTTRSERQGEVNGVDYHFISDSQFDELKKQNYFAEYASYNGWQYGTAKKDCKNDSVIVMTPVGLRKMKKDPELRVMSFYINVPRRDRLIKMLQRGDNIEEAYRRSLSDIGQFDGVEDEVDYVINNEGYYKTADEIAYEIYKVMRTYGLL